MKKSAELKIRPFRREDSEKIIDLWFTCNLVVPWNHPMLDIERKMKVNPELFLVGLKDDKIAATVMGGYEGHRGWVNYLAVLPEFRGRGYGAMMMDEIERLLLERGCPKVQLQVRETNKEVIKFYERLGYKNDNVVSLGKRLIEDPSYGG